jgi:tRNA nucleotidyltransferase/poly(A) polymerase
VLRAVRFGARFGFELDEELERAAASDAVRSHNLLSSTSRKCGGVPPCAHWAARARTS